MRGCNSSLADGQHMGPSSCLKNRHCRTYRGLFSLVIDLGQLLSRLIPGGCDVLGRDYPRRATARSSHVFRMVQGIQGFQLSFLYIVPLPGDVLPAAARAGGAPAAGEVSGGQGEAGAGAGERAAAPDTGLTMSTCTWPTQTTRSSQTRVGHGSCRAGQRCEGRH